MSPHENDALNKLLRQVAREKGLAPLSPEQAQAEYDAAEREQISRRIEACATLPASSRASSAPCSANATI